MSVKYEPRIYAPLYAMPSGTDAHGGVLYSYEHMQRDASRQFYMTVNLAEHVATGIALKTPYPDGVKLAVMKQIANEGKITLTQLRVFLGWAARRAQHTGRL